MWSLVERMMNDAVGEVFPAAQLIVVDDGDEKLRLAVGDASDDTIFDLASLTKALVTTSLAMTSELWLSTIIDRFTARELLTHSSGLPGWLELVGDDVPDRVSARAQAFAKIRATPLEYPPDSRSIYSDLGFLLLGDALETRLGAPLDHLLATRISAPLGLSPSLTYHPAADRCAPTEGELRGIVHDDNARRIGGICGHAGLFGTARDVSTITNALVRAWRGDDESVWRSSIVQQYWTPSNVPGSTWCLGWDRPAPVGELSSAGQRWPRSGVGHLGFTGCSLWIDPPRARWVILLSNRVYPTRDNQRIKQLRPALHDAIVAILDD